jgi:anhydro-N-acetylmuramic acid kinase
LKRDTCILGAMSGTSIDGLDLAILTIDPQENLQFGPTRFIPYPPDLQQKIRDMVDDFYENPPVHIKTTNRTALDQNAALGQNATCIDLKEHKGYKSYKETEQAFDDFQSRAIQKFLVDMNEIGKIANIDNVVNVADIKDAACPVDLISPHGHTLFHDPKTDPVTSIQMGNRQWLQQDLKIPIAPNLRHIDIDHGGQGAPLVPLFHRALAKMACIKNPALKNRPLFMLNIGGIANITAFIPKDNNKNNGNDEDDYDIFACDTGPGIGMLNDWIQHHHPDMSCDYNGRISCQGQTITDLQQQFTQDAYFNQPAPKSLDRLYFDPFMQHIYGMKNLSVADGAKTLIDCSIWAIMHHITSSLQPKNPNIMPKVNKVNSAVLPLSDTKTLFDTPSLSDTNPLSRAILFVHGGGKKNPVLMKKLRQECAIHHIDIMDFTTIDPDLDEDFIEAWAFAYLAFLYQKHLPITHPNTTGRQKLL